MDIMDNRRNRSKGWFLTYPQCSVAKEDLLAALQAKVDVVEYVVAAELHQDGNPHLHAFIALRGQLTAGCMISPFMQFSATTELN